MPQFDPTSFPSQLFWLAVCFGVLYLLMSKIALPRISDVVVERQRRVDDDLERATELKAQSEAAIQAYEKALNDARAQAHEVLKAAHAEIDKLVLNRGKEVADRLAVEVRAGEERIAKAKQLAVGQVREIAADAALAAVAKLAGVAADEARCRSAVDAVMMEGG